MTKYDDEDKKRAALYGGYPDSSNTDTKYVWGSHTDSGDEDDEDEGDDDDDSEDLQQILDEADVTIGEMRGELYGDDKDVDDVDEEGKDVTPEIVTFNRDKCQHSGCPEDPAVVRLERRSHNRYEFCEEHDPLLDEEVQDYWANPAIL